jgi:hypothetical protein
VKTIPVGHVPHGLTLAPHRELNENAVAPLPGDGALTVANEFSSLTWSQRRTTERGPEHDHGDDDDADPDGSTHPRHRPSSRRLCYRSVVAMSRSFRSPLRGAIPDVITIAEENTPTRSDRPHHICSEVSTGRRLRPARGFRPSRPRQESSREGPESSETDCHQCYSGTIEPKRPSASSLNPAAKKRVFVSPARPPLPNAKPHRPLIVIALPFPSLS